MKYIIVLIILISVNLSAQDFNELVKDPKSGKAILIGNCSVEAFQDTNFAWWWNSEYDMYKFHNNKVDSTKLADALVETSIEVVMGTWCSDSRREVPRLFKILDYLNFANNKIKIIAVDRSKKAEQIDLENLNIELVPTIILYKNEKEIGRIVEAPAKMTIEEDLMEFLK